jgi:multidrug efflux pump subunit AcrB
MASKNITSSSSDGRSSITVEFELGVDMDNAANDVRETAYRVPYVICLPMPTPQ